MKGAVSTPLWNLLEKKDISILDMDKYYLKLSTGLQDAANNVTEFMVDNIEDVKVKEDLVYDALIEQSI